MGHHLLDATNGINPVMRKSHPTIANPFGLLSSHRHFTTEISWAHCIVALHHQCQYSHGNSSKHMHYVMTIQNDVCRGGLRPCRQWCGTSMARTACEDGSARFWNAQTSTCSRIIRLSRCIRFNVERSHPHQHPLC